MIWARVISQSCFCWLYIASASLAAKNMINLILVLTIWWCPCVESFLVLLEEGVCYDWCILLQNSFSLCPASFCTPRPKLPVTPGISWLPSFAFQSPMMKRTSFFFFFVFIHQCIFLSHPLMNCAPHSIPKLVGEETIFVILILKLPLSSRVLAT